ncbi:D-alanine--D-alanine ligase family protein [Leptolyngbya sp. 7M]|uniref:D-alanine--D-alanine ligase family protein n=1 Tax=Leptolyngbya sp. 7M TaxID=2812896 RepID=UPI001B8C4685|nr:D-alanine--D-alanine ligase family protein [Leptolyngbya sp. 7M]QYO66367.1 D-alanine--D-alanine ligase [Leptolyngbya sp. 7M]
MKTRVGIIFGGRSGEHEISVRSALSVINAIDRRKYSLVPIAIDKEGHWLNPFRSAELFPDDVRVDLLNGIQGADGAFGLLPDRGFNGMTSLAGAEMPSIGLDVIFPVLHGTYGEDGTVQGLFELADIPYVGCGVLASACGMDKSTMKALFREAGLPICKYASFLRSEWESDPDRIVGEMERSLGYPMFVKPANLGSSVGVSRAGDSVELRRAVALAAEYDRKIIVEEALTMREIECAVLGNEYPQASLPGEYIIRDKAKSFLDYTEKYAGTGNNEFIVPAPISEELTEKVREMALAAFKAIDGSGLARVDFFLRSDNGMLLVNEINTMPGLTDASGFPKMWEGSGRSFTDVLDTLISLAIEKHADRARNKTTFNSNH